MTGSIRTIFYLKIMNVQLRKLSIFPFFFFFLFCFLDRTADYTFWDFELVLARKSNSSFSFL